MPMTLNVGLCRKVGEANFGSRGATVNFAVEIEASHLREPEQLREKIRYLFGLAREAVAEELNGHDPHAANGHTVNGHAADGQNGNAGQRPTNGRSATASQVRAIHAIANQKRIDLDQLLKERFQVARSEDLGIGQASELIDELKAGGNGKVNDKVNGSSNGDNNGNGNHNGGRR